MMESFHDYGKVMMSNGKGGIVVNSSTPITVPAPTNRWHHISLQRNSKRIIIFQNGRLVRRRSHGRLRVHKRKKNIERALKIICERGVLE